MVDRSPRLEIYDSIPSTMDAARENVRLGSISWNAEGHPSVYGVLAKTQTRGRGQRGRTWFDTHEGSLCATYYFPLSATSLERAGEVAFVAGVAVAEETLALFQAGNSAVDVGLKWPNDILANGKKLGGILIETTPTNPKEWVVLIGVGMNLKIVAFPPELAASATSFLQEGLEDVEAIALGKRIALNLQRWGDVWRGEGFAPILAVWRSYDQTQGRRYHVGGDGRVGVAQGVTDTGALRLAFADGTEIATQNASSLRET